MVYILGHPTINTARTTNINVAGGGDQRNGQERLPNNQHQHASKPPPSVHPALLHSPTDSLTQSCTHTHTTHTTHAHAHAHTHE